VSQTTSFFWFDYETFGTHPAWDRPCQFAGVRTDIDLNVIGDPLVIYCRQSPDYLPNPVACKVTGISPQLVNAEGLSESEFIGQIRLQMTQAGTCSVGYNNIRFDDEFTRHTLFRNLFEAYEQEWKDGCSRWDLLDTVRLTRALRPEGIQWPTNADGSASNRLEHLSAANGIEHSQAHDAMSDVWATLGMARLIKQQQPRLFDYAFDRRGKHAVSETLNFRERRACLQISGMIPAQRHHVSPIVALGKHPKNPNSIIVLDLSNDEEYLPSLSSDEIARRLFTPSDARSEHDPPRPGLRTVQINKCPVLVPLSVLRTSDAERLSITTDTISARVDALSTWLTDSVFQKIVTGMTREWSDDPQLDVEGTLYTGNFLSQADKQRLETLRNTSLNSDLITQHEGLFNDPRLDELVFRYSARNNPDGLTQDHRDIWLEHCRTRLSTSTAPWLDFDEYDRLLSDDEDWPDEHKDLRQLLIQYGNTLRISLGISTSRQ